MLVKLVGFLLRTIFFIPSTNFLLDLSRGFELAIPKHQPCSPEAIQQPFGCTCMLWFVVMLEGPVTSKVQLSSRLLQVPLKNFQVVFFFMMPSILYSAPGPLHVAAKHPHSMMLPPPCFTVGIVLFGLKASPFSRQTYCWSLWPNSSILISSDQRTLHQKPLSLSLCFLAYFSLALMWHF